MGDKKRRRLQKLVSTHWLVAMIEVIASNLYLLVKQVACPPHLLYRLTYFCAFHSFTASDSFAAKDFFTARSAESDGAPAACAAADGAFYTLGTAPWALLQ